VYPSSSSLGNRLTPCRSCTQRMVRRPRSWPRRQLSHRAQIPSKSLSSSRYCTTAALLPQFSVARACACCSEVPATTCSNFSTLR